MIGFILGNLIIGIGILVMLGVSAFILLPMLYRKVVATNQVHITQSRKKTTPYGKDEEAGNVYYAWPPWMPVIGITVIDMPTSIFKIDIQDYDAYDIGRVPFMVDVKAFFRVNEPSMAAQRVQDFPSLKNDLLDILQGTIRTILAKADIQTILSERAIFGNSFTVELKEQMESWGVATVKNIEFMDIRDSPGSEVIENIKAMKASEIEKDSRVEVAGNKQAAQEAEIAAQRAVDVKQQSAMQKVGERKAEKDKAVGVADELANQDIKTQQKITSEKQMDVIRVREVKQAEIDKDVAVVAAEKERKQTVIVADGVLEREKKEAEAVEVKGLAVAEAEKAMQMAPVTAQIALAQEIGENSGYMEYLMTLEGFTVGEKIGIAKARAMSDGDLKIIANAGNIESGMNSMMDLFTSGGGTNIAAMLEGLSQTEAGKKLLESVTARMAGTKKPARRI